MALSRHKTVASHAPSHLTRLFAPLGQILASGGDTRLAVDAASGLNGYGCRPTPRPEAFTFASSTATSISERGFARADAARNALFVSLIVDEHALAARLEALRKELLVSLGLGASGAAVVLSPSGTDAQLQALVASQAVLGGPVTSILVAADETGSGSPAALTGRHFNTATARGLAVNKGALLDGFADTARLDIPLTDESGRRRSPAQIDDAVLAAVAANIGAGRKVLLQTMDRSKLWRRAPSRACLAAIAARWPQDVQIVVDACQVRTSPIRLAAALGRGEMVLITGSKFFTGPPFSGALLIPPSRIGAVARARLPAGLAAYGHADDWPLAFTALRAQLPDGLNAGQWLRWEAALGEIEAYRAVPEDFRTRAIARFCAAAGSLIAEAGFELLEDEAGDSSDRDSDGEFAVRTVLPFCLRHDGDPIARDTAAGLYRALNRDVSGELGPAATAADKALAAQLCHIGQPVALRLPGGKETAALRISAGARILSESWSPDAATSWRRLDSEIEQVRVILAKLRLLLAQRLAG